MFPCLLCMEVLKNIQNGPKILTLTTITNTTMGRRVGGFKTFSKRTLKWRGVIFKRLLNFENFFRMKRNSRLLGHRQTYVLRLGTENQERCSQAAAGLCWGGISRNLIWSYLTDYGCVLIFKICLLWASQLVVIFMLITVWWVGMFKPSHSQPRDNLVKLIIKIKTTGV